MGDEKSLSFAGSKGLLHRLFPLTDPPPPAIMEAKHMQEAFLCP